MELKERIGFFLNNLNIVQKLILYIVCIHFFPYLIDVVIYLFKIKFQSQSIFKWFYISADFTELIFKPWSIFTYGFFHNQNSFSHIFWNMFLFYYFGSIVLDLFGKKTLKHLFFSGIIVGGITYVISYNLFPVFSGIKSSMIGSSAGVSSIIFFLTFYNPNYKIRIFFFDLKLLYLAIFLFLYDIIQIPYGNAGGHIAHIGGAIWGYYYYRNLYNSNFIDSFFELFETSKKRKVFKKNSDNIFNQNKIDSILDKISESGYDSLSKQEKEYLFKAGKKK